MKLLPLLVFLAMCGMVLSVPEQANPGGIKRQRAAKRKYICRTSEDDGEETKVCERVDGYEYEDGYKTLAMCIKQCH
ncbi:unnamed protein product [Cylicocyclus nassatus]|uniref:Uncharacterized protein n=1 Tax=Cylicocyclus nassatus TaxID=53992 RepID=A0AA36DIB0_CYLNA|nr:unnamed protein product [Cylicocyclus nassatus]